MNNFKYCERFRTNLISNLKNRLCPLELKDLYMHAAVLTPKYGLKGLRAEIRDNFSKQNLVRAVENHLIKHPLKDSSIANQSAEVNEIQQPKAKKLKIMSFLEDEDDDYLSSLSNSNRRNVARQVDEYLDAIRKLPENVRLNTGSFWLKYEKEWPELASYTKRILTVPASSAAVERVFSVGGAILRPSRRRLSDRLFEMLMFLKCNWHLFQNVKL
jgi:hypothetical protein